MTASPRLLAAAAFLVAAGLSAVAAQTIARVLEESSVEAVRERLEADGLAFASVLGDGLQVILEGEAPTEASRFEAISAAAAVVDGARVIDNLRVAEAQAVDPPDFAVEILRNDSGVSLIGLVPADAPREDMAEEIARAAGGQEVADLLESADYPVPEGWEPALAYALEALSMLPRAKISVAAGRVSIEAVSDSPEEKRRLESELARMAPEGVRLALAVSAPRPVIAPFTLRATLEDGRLAFDACSADTEAARDAILAAALAAGAEGPVDCRLGLGSPSPDWGRAVAAGLAALREIGGGTLAFSDADLALVARPGTDRALFERVAGELGGALPEVFALEATNPAPAAQSAPQGPPEFVATLGEEGAVRLSGRIEDERMGGLVRAFADARFGEVAVATRPGAEGLPDGWSMRVLTGLEALSRLASGSVTVTPDLIAVEGRTGRAAARDEIAARAIETLGPDAALEIEVAYDEALDPLAALPTPEECLARISSVTDAAKVTFEPGSATISPEGEPVIEAIAEILRACPDLRLRIAGYTDAQGREESNLRLSGERAEAVLAALRAERVPVSGFEARGFGEASPIASNDTEAGREANRRIEFTLLGAGSDAAPPPAPGADDDGDAAPQEPPEEAAQAMERPPAPPLRPREVEVHAREALQEAREAREEDAATPDEERPDLPEADPDAVGEAAPEGPEEDAQAADAPEAPGAEAAATAAVAPGAEAEDEAPEAPEDGEAPLSPEEAMAEIAEETEADAGGVASGPATAEEGEADAAEGSSAEATDGAADGTTDGAAAD